MLVENIPYGGERLMIVVQKLNPFFLVDTLKRRAWLCHSKGGRRKD